MDYFSEMKQKHKKLFTISWRQSASRSVVSDSLWPNDYTVHGVLQARTLEWVAFPFSRDLPNPGTEPRSPALQADAADSLPAEPQVKPKNTGLGSLSEVSRHKGSLRILEWVAYRFSSKYSQPWNKPGSPALQADSLPTELPGNHGRQIYKVYLVVHALRGKVLR